MTYPRAERVQEALRLANAVLLPLLRGARGYVRVYEAFARRPLKPARQESTGDRRIHVIVVNIPFSRPLILGIYASTQSSRPVSPAQLARRLARLAKAVQRAREGLPQADTMLIYLTRTRLTRGAYSHAKKLRVYIALTPEKARKQLASYLKRRLQALLSSTRGVIYGRVALLAYSLNQLASALDSPLNRDLSTALLEAIWRRHQATTH